MYLNHRCQIDKLYLNPQAKVAELDQMLSPFLPSRKFELSLYVVNEPFKSSIAASYGVLHKYSPLKYISQFVVLQSETEMDLIRIILQESTSKYPIITHNTDLNILLIVKAIK